MGMFDYVAVPDPLHKCPDCGARVDGFQSKDGPCLLEWVAWNEVDNFYVSCTQCKSWIEYGYTMSRLRRPLRRLSKDRMTWVTLGENDYE